MRVKSGVGRTDTNTDDASRSRFDGGSSQDTDQEATSGEWANARDQRPRDGPGHRPDHPAADRPSHRILFDVLRFAMPAEDTDLIFVEPRTLEFSHELLGEEAVGEGGNDAADFLLDCHVMTSC